MDIRLYLRYLGVRVREVSFMFGDNEAVVKTASVPQSKLNKRHLALSYHKTREAIAAGFLFFYHVNSKSNAADILSKHWAMPDVWDAVRPLLFWQWTPEGLLPENTDDVNQPSQDLIKGSEKSESE